MTTARTLPKLVGERIRRREDPRLITGLATYVDDIKLPGMLHMAIVRSTHAHARLRRVDVARAKAAPGVTLFVGEGVAAVVATDRYTAADAADLVDVEYEDLPVVVDALKAMAAGAPILHPAFGPNACVPSPMGDKETTGGASR